MRHQVGAQKTETIVVGKLFAPWNVYVTWTEIGEWFSCSRVYMKLEFQSTFAIQMFHGLFLLQVTEKMNTQCGESDLSFSSMLHPTRPLCAFLLSFCEGCTWKSFGVRSRFVYISNMVRLVTIALVVMLSFVLADPTMYKRNEQNLYEPGRYTSRLSWIRWCVHVHIKIHSPSTHTFSILLISIWWNHLTTFRPHTCVFDRYTGAWYAE